MQRCWTIIRKLQQQHQHQQQHHQHHPLRRRQKKKTKRPALIISPSLLSISSSSSSSLVVVACLLISLSVIAAAAASAAAGSGASGSTIRTKSSSSCSLLPFVGAFLRVPSSARTITRITASTKSSITGTRTSTSTSTYCTSTRRFMTSFAQSNAGNTGSTGGSTGTTTTTTSSSSHKSNDDAANTTLIPSASSSASSASSASPLSPSSLPLPLSPPAALLSLSLSPRILETLDPCVVLMKEMIGQYAHLWEEEEEEEGGDGRGRGRGRGGGGGGIFSLAQGVVYWEPPPSCQTALTNAILATSSTSSSSSKSSSKSTTTTTTTTTSGAGLHTYGPAQGIPELVEALQIKLQKENGFYFFPSSSSISSSSSSSDDDKQNQKQQQQQKHQVMVTVGANQAYVNCVLTLLHEGSKAVVFRPYYFNHVMCLQMCCGKDSVVVGPCCEDDTGIPNVEWLRSTLQQQQQQEEGQQLDADCSNKKNKSKIEMVTIVNPGNPTGVSLEREVLQQIVDLCQEYNVWLVLDCTYEYFTTTTTDTTDTTTDTTTSSSSTSHRHHQPIATFPDAPHVIHIFSFSKSYSLAGYRCGYLVLHNGNGNGNGGGNNKNNNNGLFQNMLKVQDTLPIGPPRISQIAALGALQEEEEDGDAEAGGGGGPEWVYRQYETLRESRQVIYQALQVMNGKIMGGTGAMYMMAQLPPLPLPSPLPSPSIDNNSEKEEKTKVEEESSSTSTTTTTTTTMMVRDDVEVCRQLVEHFGVAVIPGTYCGFPGWIRVCYGNLPPEQCRIAAQRLKTGLQTIVVD